ncbi:hypothetical protein ABIA30_004270 [Mycobacterium sp. MAA66]|uniref:hypothetical protein n=1 Tax=Mycobacterium sp. MAA66 TaxID=3156297 RepID=UPI003518E0F3
MSSDSGPASRAIKGDVDLGSIRRISGTRGQDDGLIELRLVGHPYRYRVRVQVDDPYRAIAEVGGTAPRLVELHLLPADHDAPAEISPATIRNVPVRRLANAAARWIASSDGSFIGVTESRDPTIRLRPDRPAGVGKHHKLDDVHYRRVADLLIAARTIGESRTWVAEQFGATKPTFDRWIAESKRRGFLPRDWATNDADREN